MSFQDGKSIEQPITGFERLQDKSTIRLEHVATSKRLHSHDQRTGWNDDKEFNEVTAYGTPEFNGDANDHWIVEVQKGDELKVMSSRVRFKHPQTGCYLTSREFKLPKWGFGQQEVTCSSKARFDLTMCDLINLVGELNILNIQKRLKDRRRSIIKSQDSFQNSLSCIVSCSESTAGSSHRIHLVLGQVHSDL